MSNIVSSFAEKASIITAILIASDKDIPLQEVLKDKKKRGALIANGNSIRLLGDLIVSPVIRVESSLKNHKSIENVIKSQLDLFCGIYTKAFSRLVTDKGFDPDEAIHLLSSKQSRTISDINNLVGESITDDTKFLPINNAIEITGEKKKNTAKFDKGKLTDDRNIFIREMEVTLTMQPKNDPKPIIITYQIMVRAIIEYVPASAIELMAKAENKVDKSFFNQMHLYLSGANSLGDLIFANKLIEEEHKARLLDDRDLIKELHDREDDANRMIATHGVVGFGKLYMMLVVSKFTKIKLENIVKERLDKDRGKQLLLDSIKAMSVTVMDDDYDMAVTYINALDGSIEYTYKSLKKNGKDDEMMDVLKLLATR